MRPDWPDPADRRYRPAAQGVAHDSLRGQLPDHRFTAGGWHRVAAPLADLRASPDGPRDRQLLAGTRFNVLLRDRGHAFGFDADEGLCGWLAEAALSGDHPVTHWVASPGTHAYAEPDLKSPDIAALSCGVRLRVTGEEGAFLATQLGHVPRGHLRPIGSVLPDPVRVARGFLGTPYLWGGNSRAGIDCSGLVQIARRACGLPCPADSDLQARMTGERVDAAQAKAGDLMFWPGHVAMVSEPGIMIHANAHHMAVVEEPIAQALERIAAAGTPLRFILRC